MMGTPSGPKHILTAVGQFASQDNLRTAQGDYENVLDQLEDQTN
jgi:hypothetical protein